MMMQMLDAGGMPCVYNGARIPPDEDNPRGYFETGNDAESIEKAEGKAIKRLLPSESLRSDKLPSGHDYRVLFMRRPLPEVVASWKKFYHRRHGRNQDGKPISYFEEPIRRSVNQVKKELGVKEILLVKYHDVLRDPEAAAAEVATFLDVPLDIGAMARAVDPALYRNRLCEKKEAVCA